MPVVLDNFFKNAAAKVSDFALGVIIADLLLCVCV